MRLTDEERRAAATIFKALSIVSTEWKTHTVTEIITKAIQMIEQTGIMKVEYLELADEGTLQPVNSWNGVENIRCFTAVQLGKVRLIDNLKLKI